MEANMETIKSVQWLVDALHCDAETNEWWDLQWTLSMRVREFERLFDARIRAQGLEPMYLRFAWRRIQNICSRVICHLRGLSSRYTGDPIVDSEEAFEFLKLFERRVSEECMAEYEVMKQELDVRGLPAYREISQRQNVLGDEPPWGFADEIMADHSRTDENILGTGVFSSINLSELPLLASRDPEMIQKYGSKQVERLFEKQVALIASSFGFEVGSAQIGEPMVDILCHVPAGTFLIEAKTSSQPYALPTKDGRAIVDYVKRVRRLEMLPPLRFVLIIGCGAAATLESKLVALENKAGAAVRFCTAADFAKLRDSTPCPLPRESFVDVILAGERVLQSEFVEEILKIDAELKKTQSDYVKARTRNLVDR